MKKRDTVDKLMTAVQRELPLVYTAMVAERDAYMAEAVAQYLKQTGMKDCCMVVGMAHMSGIERNLKLKYGFSAAAPACELVAQPA
ncbi:hypothetical protein JKP88DRAFT_35794 [Tribonema minus]|uniref:Uncharacterized protein n=1 Tax=Tribonema minus TaxID=303371 RepID=A0A836CII7_9STRA|nr:hypothetical protein JKP88DRAFT_35794 [Tribonema minus]